MIKKQNLRNIIDPSSMTRCLNVTDLQNKCKREGMNFGRNPLYMKKCAFVPKLGNVLEGQYIGGRKKDH